MARTLTTMNRYREWWTASARHTSMASGRTCWWLRRPSQTSPCSRCCCGQTSLTSSPPWTLTVCCSFDCSFHCIRGWRDIQRSSLCSRVQTHGRYVLIWQHLVVSKNCADDYWSIHYCLLTCMRSCAGDYLSDALAAQVGGIGIAPGGNINYKTGHAIFEATHGTAPKYANLDKVSARGHWWGGMLIACMKLINVYVYVHKVNVSSYIYIYICPLLYASCFFLGEKERCTCTKS